MIAGSLIGLSINGAFVSCETSCQINFNKVMIPSSAIDSGGWAEFVQGLKSWTVTVNGNLLLEAVPSDIKGLITSGFINDRPLFAEIKTYPSSTIQMSFSGAVFFTQGSISSASSGVANWTCNLQGVGILNTSYVDLALLIDAMPAIADYPIILDQSGGF